MKTITKTSYSFDEVFELMKDYLKQAYAKKLELDHFLDTVGGAYLDKNIARTKSLQSVDRIEEILFDFEEKYGSIQNQEFNAYSSIGLKVTVCKGLVERINGFIVTIE